jgi:hypothetical protein
MSKFSQIRGMLLEEAILHLLRASGYKTVDSVGTDETLEMHSAGLAVKGRGGSHQIDAIADFLVTPPFSHPQRLLLEAKCYNKAIEIGIARNAFGVLRDVEEYWVPTTSLAARRRYHYQYAIASSCGYSSDIQRYAFAHDIYLLSLANSAFFQPIITSIDAFDDASEIIGPKTVKKWLHNLRMEVRENLRSRYNEFTGQADLDNEFKNLLSNFLHACNAVNYGVIALLNGRFPIMLIPEPDLQLNDIVNQTIRIFRGEDDLGWYIGRTMQQRLFSFDVPRELLLLYADNDGLTRTAALNMKEENMSTIQLFVTSDDSIRVVILSLDMEWIEQLRARP